MSSYEFSIPSMGILIILGALAVFGVFFLWQKIRRPRPAPDRRKLKLKVAVERRKGGDRRKYPRYQTT